MTNMTFKTFLREFTTDTGALDDPQMKAALMRRMRASTDDQADRMDTRMHRDQVRQQRRDMQDEKDPRMKTLRRKKMTLQRQLDMVNDELAQSGGSDEDTEV